MNNHALTYSEFIVALSEFKIPNNNIIKEIFNEFANVDFKFIKIKDRLNNADLLINNYSVDETYLYYKELFISICTTLEIPYVDDIIDILTLSVISRRFIERDENSNDFPRLIELFEDIINKNLESNFDDDVWFILEDIKYKLLHLYLVYNVKDNINKIKSLLSVIKSNKEKYDNIKNIVESIN